MPTKFVLNRKKHDSSKDAQYELHWLPIKARIKFKLFTYTYSCTVGNDPTT